MDRKSMFYLLIIMNDSNVQHIDKVWEELKKLKLENEEILIGSVMEIIISNGIKNVHEIPKLLEFFSYKINKNVFEVIESSKTETNNNYAIFLNNIFQESKELNLLHDIIEVLINHQNIYLSDFKSIYKFCEAIVNCLSLFTMPSDVKDIREFKKEVQLIYEDLSNIIDLDTIKLDKEKLIIACMKTLYDKIIKTDPGAALTVVLQLAKSESISNLILSIVVEANDENLVKLLSTLCKWATQWLKHDTLFVWINKFIELLREQNRFEVLASVSDNCIESISPLLRLPLAHSHLHPLYYEMIKHIRSETSYKSIQKYGINVQNSSNNNFKQIGLNNLGNTCYMNSVLQALAMTTQFCDQVLTYDEKYIGKNSIICELQRLFALLMYSRRDSLSPTDFFRASRPVYFTPGQQQDSAEFLCHLLDILYEQERLMMTKPTISDTILSNKSHNDPVKLETLRYPNTIDDNNLSDCGIGENVDCSSLSSILQSSLVYRVFGGESSTTYQCNQCHTNSNNNDHYWELQLSFPEEITANQQVTINDLISDYLRPEKLTGDNMYHCDRCNSLCDAERIIQILRAPAHLILTLKHFHYDADTRLKKKLLHKVKYDEIIRIPVLGNENNYVEIYQLYAAVVHVGFSMDYGHYLTYARDRKKIWYKFNDNFVSKTTLDEFFQLQAPRTPYILFYEKITENLLNNRPIEKPILHTLSENIRHIVNMDNKEPLRYMAPKKNVQNQQNQLTYDNYQQSTSITQRRDNSDDDNPPPTNCRDSVNIQPDHSLY